MEGRRLVVVAGHIEIDSFEVPEPGPGQVLVRVSRSQVSAGSEKNALLAANSERRPTGYTVVGTVQACGPGVDTYRVHDRVLAFGNHGSHWLTGQEGLSELRASMQPIEHDAAALSDEQATFAVLGDVALLGIRRAELQIDESVAIFGTGRGRPAHHRPVPHFGRPPCHRRRSRRAAAGAGSRQRCHAHHRRVRR